MRTFLSYAATAATCLLGATAQDAAERQAPPFQRMRLSPLYWAEGIASGDFDGDGIRDLELV